jgi:peptidoglycan/xylan/chitin deacetylase (PgdA/CDA1 family)
MRNERLQYPHRRRGLDHPWFTHEPTFSRRPVAWPEGRPIAFWITVPLEFFPLDTPAQPIRPLGGLDRGYPDYWSYSNRDYGLRLGIYRIMRVLDGLNLSATAVVNAEVAARCPRVIAEAMLRNWEIMASGIDMGHLHHGNLTVEDERDLVRRARDIISNAIGRAVGGWHSPGHSESMHTLQLLKECGFEYVADWVNDDLPYMLHTAAGPLCAIPLTYEWSDRVLLVQHNLTVEDYEAQVMRAFQRLAAEAAQHGGGRILSLSVSPWIMGYPHRIATLARLLGRILESGSIWHANGMQIADIFRDQALKTS